ISTRADYCLAIPSFSAPSQIWVKSILGGLVSPSLHWGPCQDTEGDLFRIHIPTAVSLRQDVT
ncbi:mCG1039060, partial [Mus musculus]